MSITSATPPPAPEPAPAAMLPARVVVVEDDPALRRFVAAALQDLDIELLVCASTADAVRALRQKTARLVLTDLGLHGESGLVLVDQLVRDPKLRGTARIAVFSASLDPAVGQQLEGMGVWRFLAKPVSIMTLKTCVLDALADPGLEAAHAVAEHDTPAAQLSDASDEAQAITRYFLGDATLYAAFKATCIEQFRFDVLTGDAACSGDDLQALRRLAHSLGTVLATLGHEGMSALAHDVERHAAAGERVPAEAAWLRLRSALQQLTLSSDAA